MLHLQFARQELDRAAAIAAAASAAGVQDAPSPSLLQAANPAEHLVYWALEKAARKLGRLQGRQASNSASTALPLTVADVLALPLEAAENTAVTGAEAPGPQAAHGSAHTASAPREGQEEQQQRATTRQDVVGDLGLVVVTLRRPDCR